MECIKSKYIRKTFEYEKEEGEKKKSVHTSEPNVKPVCEIWFIQKKKFCIWLTMRWLSWK